MTNYTLQSLGVSGGDCLVVEDSVIGLQVDAWLFWVFDYYVTILNFENGGILSNQFLFNLICESNQNSDRKIKMLAISFSYIKHSSFYFRLEIVEIEY